MPQWTIKSVSISGGFLSDFSVQLPTGMICVIGPRGSGKSTLAEALRIVLGGIPPGLPKPRQEFIKATLGGSVLTLTTAPWADRGSIIVRRVVGQEPVLTSEDGRPITAIELDRGTFLPIDAYDGMEIEGIADENIGARRKSLLDDLSRDELQPIHLALAEQARALEGNADGIEAVKKKIASLTEQMEELSHARAMLESLPPALGKSASPEFQAAAEQHVLNAKEKKGFEATLGTIRKLGESFTSSIHTAESELRRPVAATNSLNKEILDGIDAIALEFLAAVKNLNLEVSKKAAEVQAILQKILGKLEAAHAEQQANYAQQQDLNRQAVEAYETRQNAEKAVATLDDLGKQRTAAQEELERLQSQRNAMRTEYVLTRERVSEVRERVAARLQEQAGKKVRIRVQRNADDLRYQERLTAALKGSNLRNQGDILAALTKVRPEDLAQIIRNNDAEELETQTSLGRERGRKVIESLRLNEDPMKLEVIGTDDKICIELNVSTGPDANFKDASELSRGQKCTALLPILLARQNTPLVIDQPEDNLDNHFIYETIVGSIHRLTKFRQMIFITHNANIPVLGGADLVLVMNSDGRRGFIQKSGTVDECRREIIDLLEGGEEAFELRRKRYGGK